MNKEDFKEQIDSLKHAKLAFGYMPKFKVEELDSIVLFIDNLKSIQTDYNGWVDSRGIAYIQDEKFLYIKAEGYNDIEIEILSAQEAVELILQYNKFELIEKFGLQEEAMKLKSA